MENCRLIIDTNLWISLLIGKKLIDLRKLCNNRNISIYICKELIDEFIKVASRSKIRKYATERSIADILQLMEFSCTNSVIESIVKSAVGSHKDLYLLSLANTVHADYVITGDADLLVLQKHCNARIVTLADFMTHVAVN
jgi:putative PIN family toxin of toxin-antitoxin system